MRYTGVTARGIITPIFQPGDDLIAMICESLEKACENEGFTVDNGDIIGVTEAVVGRTQSNFATCGQIAEDIRAKLGGGVMGITFPILSRNRFSILLKAIAASCEKLYVQLSYPADEFGNAFLPVDIIDELGVNTYSDSFTEAQFREKFGGDTKHLFTGIDYIELYKSFGDNIEVIFSNDARHILNYTKNVLVCDVHSRFRTQRLLKKAGAERVFRLDEILTQSVGGSGYNELYGLLGSNKSTEDKVKLFPRDTQAFIDNLQKAMLEKFGKHVELLVYGDGGFKDPFGGIWELADPVISPAFTSGLSGTTNELKMKYFTDNEFSGLSGEELSRAMRDRINAKERDLVGKMDAQGTTPRRLSDLVGSLCDLTSGSGDRGTPVIHIKGYFTNYASE